MGSSKPSMKWNTTMRASACSVCCAGRYRAPEVTQAGHRFWPGHSATRWTWWWPPRPGLDRQPHPGAERVCQRPQQHAAVSVGDAHLHPHRATCRVRALLAAAGSDRRAAPGGSNGAGAGRHRAGLAQLRSVSIPAGPATLIAFGGTVADALTIPLTTWAFHALGHGLAPLLRSPTPAHAGLEHSVFRRWEAAALARWPRC